MTEMMNKSNCTGMESKLADMLLDPARVPAKVHTHVAECEACRRELEELKATMGLLDSWDAPEPSPFFMTRMQARMREEREAAPAGWLARRLASFRAGLTYGSRSHARPLAAMALTVMLLLGGGAYLDLEIWNQPAQPQSNAEVVHDLQIQENNAQVLDQMEAMTSTDDSSGD
jgi:cytochrome c-type biogenesis protein CcmH/NrfG